jgi:hypothetical protein
MLTREELRAGCASVPLFPLPGVVFIPHTMLPLHVFEARYRSLIEDVMAGSRMLAIPCLGPGWEEEYEGDPAVLPVCGVGQVVRHQALPDGRSNIIVLGLGRMQIASNHRVERGYRVGQGELLEDVLPVGGRAGLRRVYDALRMSAAQLMSVIPELESPLQSLITVESTPVEFVDKLAHVILRDPALRQDYLETNRFEDRGDMVLAALVELQAAQNEVST